MLKRVLKRAWTSKLGWVSPKRHGSVIGMGVCLNGTAYTGMIDAAVPSIPLNYVQTQCSNNPLLRDRLNRLIIGGYLPINNEIRVLSLPRFSKIKEMATHPLDNLPTGR